MADVEVINHGSVMGIVPNTDAAREWINEHVQAEGWNWFGKMLCVEHRCAAAIVQGMLDDGLLVE